MDKYNAETYKMYFAKYSRDYRAVCVVWGICSILWCVMNLVSYIQPQWIGDTYESPGFGHIGVYKHCYPNTDNGHYECSGNPFEFSTILNDSFKAVNFLVGVSALLMLITVAALMFFFCFKKTFVFYVCGIMELVSAIFMFLGCVIYPSGWKQTEVQTICGEDSGEYNLGLCGIRWAYILAMLGIVDAAILGVLAFFLASKRPKFDVYTTGATGTVSRSEFNGFNGDTMSRKSGTNIHPMLPVVTVPGGEYAGSEIGTQMSLRRVPAGAGNFQL